MSDEPRKAKHVFGYDPIEDEETSEDPLSSSHVDVPEPDGGPLAAQDPEIRERMERARRRIRRRDAELDRAPGPDSGGEKAE